MHVLNMRFRKSIITLYQRRKRYRNKQTSNKRHIKTQIKMNVLNKKHLRSRKYIREDIYAILGARIPCAYTFTSDNNDCIKP